MRALMLIFTCAVFLFAACDDNRVFETNQDFEQQAWMSGHKPEFEVNIPDTITRYNIYFNLRNSLSYPFSRIFFSYYLEDSLGLVLSKKMVDYVVFDPKTGKPAGTSGLGDIYDHQIPLVENHQFPYPGVHRIKLEQFMRTDTLSGVMAVGVRVEKSIKE
jgi:gliding motility-associated lipoprotein GldH